LPLLNLITIYYTKGRTYLFIWPNFKMPTGCVVRNCKSRGSTGSDIHFLKYAQSNIDYVLKKD